MINPIVHYLPSTKEQTDKTRASNQVAYKQCLIDLFETLYDMLLII